MYLPIKWFSFSKFWLRRHPLLMSAWRKPPKYVNGDIVIKGTVPRDFRLQFFSSQVPEYPIRAISNFFANKLRFLQLKVHHRCCWHWWQMEKIFNQKSFNYFVWTSLVSRVNLWISFSFEFTLRCQYDIVPILCHQVVDINSKFATGIADTEGKFPIGIINTSGTGGKICHRCHWYQWQVSTSVVDTGGRFVTGVVDTSRAPWLANISANFRKNLKWLLHYFQWLGEDDSWRKPEAKISWHCPFKHLNTTGVCQGCSIPPPSTWVMFKCSCTYVYFPSRLFFPAVT